MILKRPLSENCIFLNCHFYVSEINFFNMTFFITNEYFNTVSLLQAKDLSMLPLLLQFAQRIQTAVQF